jgi:peroxiredoxin
MSKKRGKRSEEGSAAPAPAPPSALPQPLAMLSAGLLAVCALLVLVLFARALPDAAQRAKVGLTRTTDSACDALRPDAFNAALGAMPAKAPDFKLKDYAGRELSLSQLKGNVVLVNFWATWCNTCVVEMPSMEHLVDRMKGKPFRMLAVSVDEDWAPIRKFFPKGSPLEIFLDKDRVVPKLYGTDKFPESFLIDKDGTIRYYVVSNRDWNTDDVEACISGMIDN